MDLTVRLHVENVAGRLVLIYQFSSILTARQTETLNQLQYLLERRVRKLGEISVYFVFQTCFKRKLKGKVVELLFSDCVLKTFREI